MARNPIHYLLFAWLGAGAIRVSLGSSTSIVAYLFFAIFWLLSAMLLLAAIRLFTTPKDTEQRIEGASIIAVIVSLFVIGLFGDQGWITVAVVTCLVSVAVLVYVYIRRFFQRDAADL